MLKSPTRHQGRGQRLRMLDNSSHMRLQDKESWGPYMPMNTHSNESATDLHQRDIENKSILDPNTTTEALFQAIKMPPATLMASLCKKP